MLKSMSLQAISFVYPNNSLRSPCRISASLQKRYGPLRDRYITPASAGLYASHGGNRCPIGYKRIEPLPQARRLALNNAITCIEVIRTLSYYVNMTVLCLRSCIYSIRDCHSSCPHQRPTNANTISIPELPGTQSTESDAPCPSLSPQ